jgi:hypothetical protein
MICQSIFNNLYLFYNLSPYLHYEYHYNKRNMAFFVSRTIMNHIGVEKEIELYVLGGANFVIS